MTITVRVWVVGLKSVRVVMEFMFLFKFFNLLGVLLIAFCILVAVIEYIWGRLK